MTQKEFDSLAPKLKELSLNKDFPNWGKVQNDKMDNLLTGTRQDKERFYNGTNTYDSFLKLLDDKNITDEKDVNYCTKRWFGNVCAKCDEFLFYKNDGVKSHEESNNSFWDVEFKNGLQMDIKSTVIPKKMMVNGKNDVYLINHPEEIIPWMYQNQSKGVRMRFQNRLFICHHSMVNENRINYVKCAWEYKERLFKNIADNIEKVKLYDFNGAKAALIFVIENEENKFNYKLV